MARPEQIDDLNLETLARYRKRRWIDYSTSFQKYFFAKQIKKQGKEVIEDGGNGLSFEVQVNGIETFVDTGVWATDNVGTANIFKRVTVPWHMAQASYSYDVHEAAFQGDNEVKIIDVLQGRIHAMWNDWFEKMELRFWQAATSPTADPAQFYGIPTYIVQSTTAAFGFNGGNASGFTSGVGGLSRDTYTALKNGTFTYQTVSDDDFIAKLVQAIEFCNFMPPDPYPQVDKGEPDYGLYTVYSVQNRLDRLLKSQNDNLGKELWPDRPTIKGLPVAWVPALTNSTLRDGSANPAYDSNDPLYGINWRTTRITFAKGCNKAVSQPIRRAGAHNIRDVFLDSMQQLEVRDTRTGIAARKA